MISDCGIHSSGRSLVYLPKSPSFLRKLIVKEISKHPNMVHIYFNELPFASHRGWMNLSTWFKKKARPLFLISLSNKSLDWHNQEKKKLQNFTWGKKKKILGGGPPPPNPGGGGKTLSGPLF